MDKVKEIISENKVLIIVLLVILSIGIAYFIIDYIAGKKIYNSGLNSNESVNYIEKKYDDNEYKVMRIDEVDMVQLYYKDFVNKMINNPQKAWEYTFQNGENNSINFGKKYDVFKKELDKIITKKTNSNIVVKYLYENEDDYNIITIIDSENYKYEFYEYGVWKYKVSFRGQVTE